MLEFSDIAACVRYNVNLLALAPLLPFLPDIPPNSLPVFFPCLPCKVKPGLGLDHLQPQVRQVPPTLTGSDAAPVGQLSVLFRVHFIEWV